MDETVTDAPQFASYDVVLIGGAMMGSATAWFLTELGFPGRVLVVERDPSYAMCSTAHTNSCIRQQFSNELNVRISQFAADFIQNMRHYMGDNRVPDLTIQSYGYMYLADNAAFADVLRHNQKVQRAAGAETQVMTPDEIQAAYPFYHLDDIVLGSINRKDEGYWDGGTVFDWWRRQAKERGIDYVHDEVTNIEVTGGRVQSVTLASGARVPCGQVVNCAGPRAARVAAMAGLEVPIEPRKRFTWIFSAEQPLTRELPLTIDPSGVHMRQDGPKTYLAGSPPEGADPAVDPDDFEMHHDLWLNKVWPAIAARIPQFEAIKVVTEWVGHYAYNVLDQNAVIGPHPEVGNFLFLNGFSGHGLQQSPAMGRGMAELLTHGSYQSLDLSPFGYDRIAEGRPLVEKAVI